VLIPVYCCISCRWPGLNGPQRHLLAVFAATIVFAGPSNRFPWPFGGGGDDHPGGWTGTVPAAQVLTGFSNTTVVADLHRFPCSPAR